MCRDRCCAGNSKQGKHLLTCVVCLCAGCGREQRLARAQRHHWAGCTAAQAWRGRDCTGMEPQNSVTSRKVAAASRWIAEYVNNIAEPVVADMKALCMLVLWEPEQKLVGWILFLILLFVAALRGEDHRKHRQPGRRVGYPVRLPGGGLQSRAGLLPHLS